MTQPDIDFVYISKEIWVLSMTPYLMVTAKRSKEVFCVPIWEREMLEVSHPKDWETDKGSCLLIPIDISTEVKGYREPTLNFRQGNWLLDRELEDFFLVNVFDKEITNSLYQQ